MLEPAFKSILERDPHNDQAKHNLEVLCRKTGRWVEGITDQQLIAPVPIRIFTARAFRAVIFSSISHINPELHESG